MGNESRATTLIGDVDNTMTLDNLTGLPGRGYLLKALDDALQATTGTGRSVAVFTLDVDRFKTVNDTRGFVAGDDTLPTLATKLATTLRPDDLLAHFGSDEFTIVCPDVFGVAEAATPASASGEFASMNRPTVR